MVKFLFPFFLISLLGITACSDDKGSGSSEESSSSSEEIESSSSYSNRLDAAYLDTLVSGDTADFYFTDSTESPVRLFLGELPAGTRITLASATTDVGDDTLSVREELGATLLPTEPVTEDGDEIYTSYTYPGDGATLLSNTFITDTAGYYYAELRGTFQEGAHLRISTEIQEAYYGYLGDTTAATLETGDTLRGFFLIGSGARQLSLTLSTPGGYSINILARNAVFRDDSLSLFKTIVLLDEDGDSIASSADSVEELLLPQDTASWQIQLVPLSIQNYLTGPYAFFEVVTSSRQLDKGEYFAWPDSIEKVGDTLTIVRARNDAAKYYLRQDQYVWLADLEKGDSIYVFHEIEGYYTGPSYPATYAILNADGDSIAAITSANYSFVATEDGPFYLHYTRLNSPPKTESQELTLKTLLQRPGYITTLAFYDEDKGKTYTSTSLTQGDSLAFDDIVISVAPSDASTDVLWYIPCADLDIIGTAAYSPTSCSGTEQLISAAAISALGEAGDTGHLIAESKADPEKRDTLSISILE